MTAACYGMFVFQAIQNGPSLLDIIVHGLSDTLNSVSSIRQACKLGIVSNFEGFRCQSCKTQLNFFTSCQFLRHITASPRNLVANVNTFTTESACD